MQDVVNAVVFSGFFICRKILRRLHHHDHAVVALDICADRAQLFVGQGLAALAVLDVGFCFCDRIGQPFCLVGRHMNDMEGQTLGGFAHRCRAAMRAARSVWI